MFLADKLKYILECTLSLMDMCCIYIIIIYMHSFMWCMHSFTMWCIKSILSPCVLIHSFTMCVCACMCLSTLSPSDVLKHSFIKQCTYPFFYHVFIHSFTEWCTYPLLFLYPECTGAREKCGDIQAPLAPHWPHCRAPHPPSDSLQL